MEFVFAANDGQVSWGPTGGTVWMRPNDLWWADDPFVVARPDLFSSTPTFVHSTSNRPHPSATPLPARRPKAGARG